jgi:hypothetical protein
MADLVALHSEIVSDPAALGYAGKNDQQVADLLNSTTTGRTQARKTVTKNEILSAIRNADYPTTSAQDAIRWNKLNLMLSVDTIDASSQNVKDTFNAIFSGTPTLTNLSALGTRVVSRAEELGFGPITAGDVQQARVVV